MVDPKTPCDEELVRAAQGGELEAFTSLYERYLPVVYNRVRYMIPEEDIEDVTQEVFIAVIKSLKSFRYEARFSTWLRTLVNRQVADYYRRRNPKKDWMNELPDYDPERDSGLREMSEVEEVDEMIILRQALRELPEHYREVIMLRFADGMQFGEIAQLQGLSLEATKSLFRRAIASLAVVCRVNR